MKIKKTVYCLICKTKKNDNVTVDVDVFGDYDEAIKAMTEVSKNKYENLSSGTQRVDTFAACVESPDTAWYWDLRIREMTIEVADPEPAKKMWALSCKCDTYESVHGVYVDRSDAYAAMCEEFKAECDRALGNTPFVANVGEASADFEPDHGEWSHWKIKSIDITKGGTTT